MDNFSLQLAHRVAKHEQFQTAYESLQKESLASLSGREPGIQTGEQNKLLRSALILAQSGKSEYSMLAQDIVYALATLPLESNQRAVCQHILALLGNFPASDFLKGDGHSHSALPWQLQLSEQVRRDENFVTVLGKKVLLTDFQANVWDELEKEQFLSIAAPTSAGKSFLIQLYLKAMLGNSDRLLDIAYVVPTRSLIHEVQASLTKAFQDFDNAPIISSVPRSDERLAANQSRIFVFTQERLRTAMDESELALDCLIVDEAQQIADGSRGMLLLSCLEDVHLRAPHAQILFITPGSRSGSSIGALMGLGELPSVETTLRPVRQNLIYVNFKSANKKQHLQLTLHREEQDALSLEKVHLDGEPVTNAGARFLTAVMKLGDEGQNLVYASGKAAAEDMAASIVASLKATGGVPKPSPSLLELSDFVKRHVHPQYSLAECIKSGVAYHYGSMPTTLTKAIEEYFSSGALKYLVCTSTLLQGVNLPARNIFIRNPKKGKGKPMGPEDFWNLAGRAGRLSKDTHGNVFLIEYRKWDRQPVEEERQKEVTPSLSKAFTSAHSEVMEFIQDENHVSGVKETNFAESVFTRLFIDAKDGLMEQTIERATMGRVLESADAIRDAIYEHLNKVKLPPEILKRNASVSPLRQQAMFDVLVAAVKSGKTKQYVPPHPLQTNNVKERLKFVMTLIHTHLEGVETDRENYFGWFALSWMRGNSLRDMIEYQLRYARDKAEEDGKAEPEPRTVIIKVLDDVENKLRFHYVRYIGCYIDLLKHAVDVISPDRELDVPAIPLFLELGACSGTMIGCMELGLSRIAAKELRDMFDRNDLDSVAIKKRLKNLKIKDSQLSPIIISEIKRLGLVS
ncbi:DEAD/DEAH box helicase [Herbaspirillum sp. C9C3]|uniref:DEAD/DEAH box helicase n=1 Tax=Herbaspirillum sp. C9C3 TaxID=2735271 RepID=UPI00158534D5|nr:DEAD/DEAH box helicase [Herbaspirillum sp. C9C3]NUT60756.1 DEAD/DEAH box helicase [Herbaspirillum sp. C9C3]